MRNRAAQYLYSKFHPDWGLGLMKKTCIHQECTLTERLFKHDGLKRFRRDEKKKDTISSSWVTGIFP